MVHTAQAWPTPGYDQEGAPYPIFAAIRGLADLKGEIVHELIVTEPGAVDGVAVARGTGHHVVLANLTAAPRQVLVGQRSETIAPFGLLVGAV